MKHIALLLVFVLTSPFAIAFTSNDITTAQSLADQNIIVNHANNPLLYRLDDTITRAELLSIALKMRDQTVSSPYTCKKYYKDVLGNSWVCAVVELAADEWIVSRDNQFFRPSDTVTRAEALAILMRAKEIDIQNNCWGISCEGISIDSKIAWHADVFLTAFYAGLASPDKIMQDFVRLPYRIEYTFRPNEKAKRSEVFGFANNIVNYLPYIPEEITPTGILTPEELTNLKKDAYIQGNADAKILVLEFADFECPFCKRMHEANVIKNLQKKYGDSLAFIYQHYPLPFHPLALPAAHTAECVWAQWGSDAFYSFVDKLYSYDTPSQENIDTVLSQLSLANESLRNCVKNKTYATKIDTNISRAGEMGVTGTPGTLIINTKTGNYEIVSGAQPEVNFVEVVDRLLQ